MDKPPKAIKKTANDPLTTHRLSDKYIMKKRPCIFLSYPIKFLQLVLQLLLAVSAATASS